MFGELPTFSGAQASNLRSLESSKGTGSPGQQAPALVLTRLAGVWLTLGKTKWHAGELSGETKYRMVSAQTTIPQCKACSTGNT